jgi:prephenate dehydrogenase
VIGIVGYGRFGKLTARYLSQDRSVVVYRRRETTGEPWEARVRFAGLAETCRQPVVILTVPISAMEAVLGEVAPLLKPGALVVDVCSVKELPIRWMREALPVGVSILATHPMFGPDSAADSLEGRKIVLCRERLPERLYRLVRRYLSGRGLAVIEAGAEEHDRQIAVSLALTHFIGRSLSGFGARGLAIDTEGYRRLLHILGVVENDTWQLFHDMHRYNAYAAETRRAFMDAMAAIERRLAASHPSSSTPPS